MSGHPPVRRSNHSVDSEDLKTPSQSKSPGARDNRRGRLCIDVWYLHLVCQEIVSLAPAGAPSRSLGRPRGGEGWGEGAAPKPFSLLSSPHGAPSRSHQPPPTTTTTSSSAHERCASKSPHFHTTPLRQAKHKVSGQRTSNPAFQLQQRPTRRNARQTGTSQRQDRLRPSRSSLAEADLKRRSPPPTDRFASQLGSGSHIGERCRRRIAARLSKPTQPWVRSQHGSTPTEIRHQRPLYRRIESRSSLLSSHRAFPTLGNIHRGFASPLQPPATQTSAPPPSRFDRPLPVSLEFSDPAAFDWHALQSTIDAHRLGHSSGL
jgi:hypothetical protein